MNGTNFEPQDIQKWDKDIKVDLIMHGSPCQDFSLAGKQAGGDEGSGTRSSLMYETIRIVNKLKPKYVIWENVRNLLSTRHKHNFDKYVNIMREGGYDTYYQILNSKDYGVPQNRERVFTISIKRFEFPEKQELKLKLQDLLENNVNDKYYISDKMKNTLLADSGNWIISEKKYEINRNITRAINTREGCYRPDMSEYICNELPENYNLLNVKSNNKKGYEVASAGDSISIAHLNSTTRRGRVGKQVSQTLSTEGDMAVALEDLKIRRLTPKECWRLMGFTDAEFEKAEKVNSDTQLYKQAGNSIVVNVLENILEKLL
jgi:DNA (cytosine-5)-methyltransferase 1